jgi:predicted MFS family arabinose efflux permease
MNRSHLPARTAVGVFLAFASAYFISATVRAVTATLAPALIDELQLQARDLGLLAGGYSIGFAATQLPLGRWLDRYGPRRVILSFLTLAVLGCALFALAQDFAGLMAARMLTGAGVSACLMAPLTGFRRWARPELQLRLNSWMLMTGSLGMLASTLPVQWLLPLVGWRGVFWGLTAGTLLAMAAIAWVTPAWSQVPGPTGPVEGGSHSSGYGEVWRHPVFRRMAPIGFFNFGGMVAVQTLWAGPWMVQVCGYTPAQAASGLFGLNLMMLVTFWLWGTLNPGLARRGWSIDRLMGWGVPLSLGVLAVMIALGPEGGWLGVAAFCVAGTFSAQAQPAVGMAFPAHMAGRALSAFNLLIFAGIFTSQWVIGLWVDAFIAAGWPRPSAFQGAMAVCWGVFALSYGVHRRTKAHNSPS